MKILLLILTILLKDGAFVRQVTPRDSVLVADRLLYGFEMDNVPDSTQLLFPPISNPLMEDVVCVPAWQVDTLKIQSVRADNSRLLNIRAQFPIQPFVDGEIELPALWVARVRRDGTVDTIRFNALTVDVRTMPVDTATFVPHDLRPQMRYPLTWAEVVPWVVGLWSAVLLVAGIVALILSRRRKDIQAQSSEPAHVTALRKLDKFRGNKYWAPEKQKQFYSGVTDALREYIVARYGVGAMEMTTAEIFDALKGTDIPDDLYREMRDLFERADFVKFAAFVAPDEDNATVLPQAVRFVTSTYQIEVEEEVESGKIS